MYLCDCIHHCLFVGQFKSPHHSDQMSQGSQLKMRRFQGGSSILFSVHLHLFPRIEELTRILVEIHFLGEETWMFADWGKR